MSYQRIVVIGGSIGAIDALRAIVSLLPRSFGAPICIVQHLSAESPGLLPSILRSVGQLDAQTAEEGALVQAGRIYVAPPNHHFLLSSEGRVLLGSGPKENRFRPSVDPLFRSAAQHFGAKCIGLILSGGLDDGVAGLAAIKDVGGIAIAQLPEDAVAPSMPLAALRAVAVDYCLPADQIAGRLTEIVAAAPGKPPGSSAKLQEVDMENDIAAGQDPKAMDLSEISDLSRLTCPDCGGVLRRAKHPPLRYRCHTGHAYTAGTLGDAVHKRSNDSIWAALQRHNEEECFLRDAIRSQGQDDPDSSKTLQALADETTKKCDMLRTLLRDFGD